jgi:HlyD family secretion protein
VEQVRRILIAFLIGLIFSASSCSKKAEEASVNSTTVKQEKTFVEATGMIKTESLRNIIIDFPAEVDKVHVKNGQRVKKGDKLVTLNFTQFQAQISAKQHELNIANLEIKNTQEKVSEDSKNNPELKKLLNDYKFAEELYKKAQEDFLKQETLYNSGAISQYELEEFKKIVDSKKKNLDDIQFSIDSSEYNKRNQTKDIKVLREKAASIELDIKLLKGKLVKSYIKQNEIISDVENAIVYDIGYAQGDNVFDSKKVLSLMDLSTIVVEANVPEEFIKDVKIDSSVNIHPIADNSKSYTGKVIKVSDMAINQNGQTLVPVYISVDNTDEFLKPNFNVDVEINMIQ